MRPYYNDGFFYTDTFSSNEVGVISRIDDDRLLNEEAKETLENHREQLNGGIPRGELLRRMDKRR